jgi:hypothetical protein
MYYFLPPRIMTVEHHYHAEGSPAAANSDSSAMTVVLAIVAILFIIGLGVFAMRSAGYNMGAPAAGTRDSVNIDLNTNPGAVNPGTDAPSNP